MNSDTGATRPGVDGDLKLSGKSLYIALRGLKMVSAPS